MRRALCSALILAACALPTLASASGRTFAAEIVVARSDGQTLHRLVSTVKVAPAGQLVNIDVPSMAPDSCSAADTSAGCAPWLHRSLRGSLQATPVGQTDFVVPGDQVRVALNLTSQVGSDLSTARLMAKQVIVPLFKTVVVATETVDNQAVIYTIKVSEPNEISILK